MLVLFDSRIGVIWAMVGGRGFQLGEREVNMVFELCQIGSSIKFFIFVVAL